MHARIDQLLSLRDGEPVDAHVRRHVQDCAVCQAEAARFTAMRAQLQALPQRDAPNIAWERIQTKARRSPRRRRFAVAAAIAGIAGLAGLLAAVMREPPQPQQANITVPPVSSTTLDPVVPAMRLAELVARSRELETALQILPARPRIERVATAATIDSLQERIQWLDVQLSYAPEESLNDEQAESLWRERVNLMDSLVKVRYAEIGRTAF